MTRREWLDAALKVLGGAGGLFAFALAVGIVSDELGRMFLYGAGMAAVAGALIIAGLLLTSRS